jgi:hypothetical protein
VLTFYKDYVTVLFGLEEDLKASNVIAAETTIYKGVSVASLLPYLGLNTGDVWPGKKEFSLWDAKLFPVAQSAAESAELSLKIFDIVRAILNQETIPAYDWKDKKRISLNDAILAKGILTFDCRSLTLQILSDSPTSVMNRNNCLLFTKSKTFSISK